MNQSLENVEAQMLEFTTYTLLDDGACGAISPPVDEFDCDWTISAAWPEV